MIKLNRRKRYCACNQCGIEVFGNNKFVRGHSARVIHWSKGPNAEIIKNNISETRKKRFASGEIIHPCLGKTKLTNPNFSNSGCKKGTVPYNKGKGDHLTPEKRAIVTAASTGRIPWNKGKTGYFSEEALASITESSKNRRHTAEEIQRIKINTAIALQDPEKRGKMSKANKGISKSLEFCKQLSERISGPGNPWYIDGRCSGINQPYPLDFNNKFKELIRERDGGVCQMCMKTEKENGKQLDVHHINYDRTDCDPKNMISLCHSCHMKTNVKRKDWISFFSQKQITEERAIIN